MEAKICRDCGKSHPVEQFYRDKRSETALRQPCKICIKETSLGWYEKNRARKAITVAAWKEQNRDKVRAQAKMRYWADPDKHRASALTWQKRNRSTVNQYKRAYRHINPEAVVRHEINRKVVRQQAQPVWADGSEIGLIYRRAKALSKETGIDHVVDHTIPLRHRLVCGLHVQHNLDVITRKNNERKGNRWWPDMPDFAAATGG